MQVCTKCVHFMECESGKQIVYKIMNIECKNYREEKGMYKCFCDICNKEIKGDIFTALVQRQTPKEKCVHKDEICRECANKILDVLDPDKTISRG